MNKEKNELRLIMKKKRNAYEENKRKLAEEKVVDYLKTAHWFLEAENVYIYASYGSEFPTKAIAELAWSLNKKVAFPRVIDKENMKFYEVTSYNELETGHYGILEPKADLEEFTKEGVMFLPGLAFDKNKNRMGYGGGFYDRYLSRQPENHIYKVGLCFDFQYVSSIPTEENDIKMDQVMTV